MMKWIVIPEEYLSYLRAEEERNESKRLIYKEKYKIFKNIW